MGDSQSVPARPTRRLSWDGLDALYPRYRGGRPQTFTLHKRQEIKRIALRDPPGLGQPFATWSLSKLADYLVAEGWSRTSPTRGYDSCSSGRASAFKR